MGFTSSDAAADGPYSASSLLLDWLASSSFLILFLLLFGSAFFDVLFCSVEAFAVCFCENKKPKKICFLCWLLAFCSVLLRLLPFAFVKTKNPKKIPFCVSCWRFGVFVLFCLFFVLGIW